MRIPFPAAAAFAFLCAASPAAAQEVRGIVFTVTNAENGHASLEPVALMLRHGFTQPVEGDADSVLQAFHGRWFGAGRAYPVLSRGEAVGSITVRQVEEQGCYGVSALGALDVRGRLDADWQGLAGEGLPEQRDAPWLREPTVAEKRDLDRMAAALFAAHGIDVARRVRGDTATAALIGHPNARPVLVASYALQTDDAAFRQAALLLIAEDGDDGYRPAYTWFLEAVEADVESRTLVDAADLDGDGQAELVVRRGFYESWSYTILSRTPEGWREVYHGGGGGC